MKVFFSILFLAFFISANCQGKRDIPVYNFDEGVTPTAPDYNDPDHWAALPDKEDYADGTPANLIDNQEGAEADVFFIHPTTYTGKNGQNQWNGGINDEKLNKRTDKTTIKYQASAFNLAGRVFAPRYRQAHIHCYFSEDTDATTKAFDLAYSDVKGAFEYYLKHYNSGRPIIIASHSQGSTHGIRLIKEFFDGKELQDQFVAAYLIGMRVLRYEFEHITPCENESETGCVVSWRTFANGYYPPWYKGTELELLATNPLTWKTNDDYADYSLNKGAVLKNFKKVKTGAADAQVHGGMLWINRLKVFGAKLLNMKNYHVADINLYYINLRENADIKVRTFIRMAGGTPNGEQGKIISTEPGGR